MIILSTFSTLLLILFVLLYLSQIKKNQKLRQKLTSEHHSKVFYFQEFNKKLQNEIEQRTIHLESIAYELQKSNKDLDTFIYKTSHDIKSPLSSLEGLCEIMLMEKNPTIIKEYVKKQKHTLNIMQLLLFRVVEIGDIRHHKVITNPVKMLSYFKKVIRGMTRQENYNVIDFQFDIEADLTINTDLEMLDLIIINLIKNAMENIENFDKDKLPIVRIIVEEKDNQIIIIISDNGKGVPKDIETTLFDMFIKGQEGDKNFGLGLYKAKIASKKIEGKLSFVKNAQSQGACFTVTLPKNLEVAS